MADDEETSHTGLETEDDGEEREESLLNGYGPKDDEDEEEEEEGEEEGDEDDNDDDDNDDDSGEATETLVAGREKRSTAGRNLSTLLNAEADDELALLFAEEEDDDEFDETEEEGGIDGGDGDDMRLDSSSEDEDDQGPTAGDDDLEGERELEKQARAERKKRKAEESLRLQTLRKKVKIDPTAISSLKGPAPRPKKKSERISWLPTNDDGPTRSSSRRQTMKNKELTHARLKDSEQRRIKLIATMEEAAKRKERMKTKVMTQEERLAEAEKVERLNSKSLNRWEEMEKKRAEERRAKLEALQNRRLEGPVMSWWSGIAKWVDGKLTRVGKVDVRPKPEKEETERKKKNKDPTNQDLSKAEQASPNVPSTAEPPATRSEPAEEQPPIAATTSVPENGSHTDDNSNVNAKEESVQQSAAADVPIAHVSTEVSKESAKESAQRSPSFLDGIEDYASQSEKQKDANEGTSDTVNETHPPEENTAPAEGQEQKDIEMTDNTKLSGDEISKGHASISKTEVPPPEDKDQTRSELEIEPSQPKDVPSHPITEDAKETEISVSTNEQSDGKEIEVTESTQPSKEPALTRPSSEAPAVADATTPDTEHQAKDHTTSNTSQIEIHDGLKDGTSPPEPTVAGPQVVEETGRNLLILENFDEKTAQSRDYSIYFNAKKPPRLTKVGSHLCVITSLPSRYRDPETSLPFANAVAYREIRQLTDQKYVWSAMLGCYVGSTTTAASGVPDRFLGGYTSKDKGKASSTDVDKSASASDKGKKANDSTIAEGKMQVDTMDVDK